MKSVIRIVLAAVAALILLAPAANAVTPSADLLRCHKKLGIKARVLAKLTIKKMQVCTEKVIACKLADEIDAVDPTSCLAAATTACSTVDTVLDARRTAFKTSVDNVCAFIPLADLLPFVGSTGYVNVATDCGAATTTALTDCLLDDARCSAEGEVFRADPRAVDSLTSAGVAASFPCAGP
jgi:hypothetical protein